MAKPLEYLVEPTSAKSDLSHDRSFFAESRGGPCPACGAGEASVLFAATDRRYATTAKLFQIVECEHCRLIRLDPRPTPWELRSYYPTGCWMESQTTVPGRLEEFYRRLVLRGHLRFTERALRESEAQGIVLDVGCGSRTFLEMLAERGRKNVVGLDFALDASPAAWKHPRASAICGTLSQAPFAPASCAAITMLDVLEHLYDPAAYLNAAWDLLAPDGRLIVQVPNAASWQFLLFGERWSGLDVPRHLLHFRLKDLEALLDKCGFEILRSKHFSLRDNPQGLAVSLAPRLDPAGRRVRQVPETPRLRMWKDLAFLGLMAASVPFTLLEAACRAGSTVMIEARKK